MNLSPSKWTTGLTAGMVTMADRGALKLVGLIFASVTFAVMLTTTMIVKGYADGIYSLDTAPAAIESAAR